MAEEEKNEQVEDEARTGAGRKKGLFLGGGALAVVATAAVLSFLALPGRNDQMAFDGPYVMSLVELEAGQALTANLAGEGGRRYLVLDMKVEYEAYTEAYGKQRIADPLYIAKLQDKLLTMASQKTAEDVLERSTQEIFLEELHAEVEPILFPVHVGSGPHPSDPDESGLRPGRSILESTMRAPFHEQALAIDATKRTIRMGEGEEHVYDGDEENLVVRDDEGRVVYLDVTRLREDFVGEVRIGVKGRIRNLYKVKLIIQ